MSQIENKINDEGGRSTDVSEKTLPPFSEEMFISNIANIVPNNFIDDDGYPTANAKDVLDRIYVW